MSYTEKGAVITEGGVYRYELWREWVPVVRQRALFIMLNPSTADGSEDDPTIRRCVGFAKALRCQALDVVNLFAYRATDPHELASAVDPVGPGNDKYIRSAIRRAHVCVAAWGANPLAKKRACEVDRLASEVGRSLYSLATSKDGSPRHPLYLPAAAVDQRDHSIPFWCPNGHRQVFAGKTVEQKLRERVEAEQLRTRQARDQAEAAERTARAYKGQATKIKRRVLRGVCPFCDRSFENVTRHMESKHSDTCCPRSLAGRWRPRDVRF